MHRVREILERRPLVVRLIWLATGYAMLLHLPDPFKHPLVLFVWGLWAFIGHVLPKPKDEAIPEDFSPIDDWNSMWVSEKFTHFLGPVTMTVLGLTVVVLALIYCWDSDLPTMLLLLAPGLFLTLMGISWAWNKWTWRFGDPGLTALPGD